MKLVATCLIRMPVLNNLAMKEKLSSVLLSSKYVCPSIVPKILFVGSTDMSPQQSNSVGQPCSALLLFKLGEEDNWRQELEC